MPHSWRISSPRFIHHPESKRLIIEMLIDLGC